MLLHIKWITINSKDLLMYTLLYLKWITTVTYHIAQGTLLSVTWQPGWERNLRENGYMYMYG